MKARLVLMKRLKHDHLEGRGRSGYPEKTKLLILISSNLIYGNTEVHFDCLMGFGCFVSDCESHAQMKILK